MLRYDAVLFDLDGTLLNTLPDLTASANAALAMGGYPQRSIEEICRFVGNGVAQLIHRALPDGTGPQEESLCLARFRAHYAAHMQVETTPYPGIPALLDRLAQAGCRIGVVSNKFDAAVKQLCAAYFGALVPLALGEGSGHPRKPAPDSLLLALDELGVSSDRAVYVGDSEVDLRTAHNAGVPCISVSWGFRPRSLLLAQGATQMVDTPAQLESILLPDR